jgi:hypothetical protein
MTSILQWGLVDTDPSRLSFWSTARRARQVVQFVGAGGRGSASCLEKRRLRSQCTDYTIPCVLAFRFRCLYGGGSAMGRENEF